MSREKAYSICIRCCARPGWLCYWANERPLKQNEFMKICPECVTIINGLIEGPKKIIFENYGKY